MFGARFIEAQRHDDTVAADVDPIDQQCHQLEGVERRRPPRIELRLRLRHKPPTHGTLTRAPRADVGTQRF